VTGVAISVVMALGVVRSPGAQQESAPTVAITHVTVIDVERGERLPDRTVLIHGGRVAAVESAGRARVPAGAHIVDGARKYLLPGLWDMHTHPSSEADLARLLAHGVTGIRVMHGNPSVVRWKGRIGRGELLGPTIVAAGPIVEGLPPPGFAAVIDTVGRSVVTSTAEAAREVRAQKAAGYDFIKVYNNVPREAYDAIVAEARRQQMRVAGHVPFAVGLRGVLAARQASIEHLRGYPELLVPKDAPQQPGADLRSRVLAWRFADTTLIPSLARETRDAGVWSTPTLSTRLFTAPRAVVEQYLGTNPESEGFLQSRSRIPWLSNFTDDDFRLAEEGNAPQRALLLALRASGAGLLAGTDMGPWGASLHQELRFLVDAGLSPAEALRAATLGPALFLGAADTLGLVTAGRRADLVLLDADPLADIRNTTTISLVMVGGRVLDRKWLDEALFRR